MIAKGLMVLSGIAFFAVGIYMWIVEMIWFNEWWGGLGVFAGLIFPPLAAFFPLIFVLKEGWGEEPLYWVAWGIGLVALIFYGLCHVWAERRETAEYY